jgi:HPt (histidine-containing phosphotransfer) domain-containing protein
LLAACDGNDAILRVLCEGLRTSLPAHLATIRNALEAQDFDELRKTAHKLCGMVSTFSTWAGSVASELEDCAAGGQLDEARPLVDQLETIGEDLAKAVTRDLTAESLRHDQAIRGPSPA